MWRVSTLVACLVTALAIDSIPAGADQSASMKTVAHVDLDRYAGRWYEVSRLPNRFQKGCSGNVTAEYGIRQDGRISVVNRCLANDGKEKKAEGVARVVDETTPAKLEEATYRGILERIEELGYDPNDLVRTSQDSQ